MPTTSDTANQSDRFDLQRFLSAQKPVYDAVLKELRDGKKRTHWMWFIFPQFDGLGYSPTSKHYAIKSAAEARAYLDHPVLGSKLKECAETIVNVKGRSASAIFGSPDDVKLQSSMTLFETIAEPGSVFAQVLDAYFQGKRDRKTLDLLKQHAA